MRFAVRNHSGKEAALVQALLGAGATPVAAPPADVLLIDLDDAVHGFRPVIDAFSDAGATVLQYPHGASPLVAYDGMLEAYDRIDAHLAIGPGHAELLRRVEYPRPIHQLGWSLCPLLPFRAAERVRRVLFAPTHPSGHGVLHEIERTFNARSYARLLDGPWELTVRHIGTLEQNGLHAVDGVRYVQGDYALTWADVDAADVVVAAPGTFPSLAVARGVPTVTYGQGHGASTGDPGETLVEPRLGHRYRNYVRYPFDLADGPTAEVLHSAARSEAPIATWKRRFVGRPMDPAAFAAQVGRLVARTPEPPLGQTRALTVGAFLDELLEEPQLLADYADRFTEEDDATLVLLAPGALPEHALADAEAVLAAAGLAADALPDVLIAPLPGGAALEAELAERCDALLTRWPATDALAAVPHVADAAALDAPLTRAA